MHRPEAWIHARPCFGKPVATSIDRAKSGGWPLLKHSIGQVAVYIADRGRPQGTPFHFGSLPASIFSLHINKSGVNGFDRACSDPNREPWILVGHVKNESTCSCEKQLRLLALNREGLKPLEPVRGFQT